MNEQSTGKSFIALSSAGILVKLLSLLYVPLIIRILGDEGYGIYLASYDIFSLIYVITNSGMQIAISKQIAKFVALDQQQNIVKTFYVGKRILFFIGIVSAILLAISSRTISMLIKSDRSYLGILFLSPTIFLTSVLAAYRGLFQGISYMTPVAFSQVLEQIFNIVLSLMFAIILVNNGLEFGAAGGTVGTTIGALIAIVFLYFIVKKKKIIYNMSFTTPYMNCELERRNSVPTKEIVKSFFIYGIPVILTSGIQYVGSVIDLALVKNRLLFAGFNLSESDILYGFLGKYKSLIYVPLALIVALSSSIIPGLVKSMVLKDKKDLFKKVRFSIKISLFISIPASLILSVLSKPLYQILFSHTYSDGYKLMLYGSILVVFMSIVQIQTTILQSINRFYLVFLSLFIGVLIKLIVNYFLVGINYININGAVISSILSFWVPMLINSVLFVKYMGFKSRFLKRMIKPFCASLIMGVFVLISYNFIYFIFGSLFLNVAMYLAFGVSAIIGSIVYIVFIIIFKYLDREDLDFLPDMIVNRIPKK